MKRIVICCDGTWKRVDAEHPTNVVRLAQAVMPRGRDGMAQVVFHLDGVGTGRGTGAVARGLDRMLGGMFGQGLMATLEAAYRFLIFNYVPGDAIFLMGFSRGAFMARSLAGLVRTSGILDRTHAAMIPAALELYRTRGEDSHPDGEAARAFRARYGVRGAETAHGAARFGPAEVGIRYLGVWDTVGALGLPGHLALAGRVNRGLRFHDMALSRSVQAARHAVAIDERRAVFPPALWDNLDALNASVGERRYLQRWFPGDHASVGGGGAVTALSSDAALWIAEGAMKAGLAFDPAVIGALSEARNCCGPLTATQGGGYVDRMLHLGQRDRAGPVRIADIAPAALQRWEAIARYRPGALAQVRPAIEAGRKMPRRRRPGRRAVSRELQKD